jgi:serine/threonine protein kinase
MGEVYRATDTRLNRPVAIKLLPADLSRDPGLRHRLKREGQAVSCLNHPHICTLFDIGRHEEMDYLVMEYLEGETLADRLSKAEIPIEQALQYAIELADALSAAHRQGVIHRDIKPGNIMLVETGTKLLDFGLARISDPTPRNIRSRADEENVQTQCGAIVGTIQYMSPEQLEGGIADERADIFALGAVLYEMFAARKAFEGKSHASLITSIMSSMPPPISTVRPVVPEAIDPLIQKCLHKDPEERWQSASDVRSELERIAASVPEKTTPQRLLPVSTNAEALSWGSLALGCTLGLSLGVIFSVKGRREG